MWKAHSKCNFRSMMECTRNNLHQTGRGHLYTRKKLEFLVRPTVWVILNSKEPEWISMSILTRKEGKRHRKTLIPVNTSCKWTAQLTDTAKCLEVEYASVFLLTGLNEHFLWLNYNGYRTLQVYNSYNLQLPVPYHLVLNISFSETKRIKVSKQSP